MSVLDILKITEAAFENISIHTIDIFGKMRDIEEAKRSPLNFAAANWCATSKLVAETFSTASFADLKSRLLAPRYPLASLIIFRLRRCDGTLWVALGIQPPKLYNL